MLLAWKFKKVKIKLGWNSDQIEHHSLQSYNMMQANSVLQEHLNMT